MSDRLEIPVVFPEALRRDAAAPDAETVQKLLEKAKYVEQQVAQLVRGATNGNPRYLEAVRGPDLEGIKEPYLAGRIARYLRRVEMTIGDVPRMMLTYTDFRELLGLDFGNVRTTPFADADGQQPLSEEGFGAAPTIGVVPYGSDRVIGVFKVSRGAEEVESLVNRFPLWTWQPGEQIRTKDPIFHDRTSTVVIPTGGSIGRALSVTDRQKLNEVSGKAGSGVSYIQLPAEPWIPQRPRGYFCEYPES